MVFNRRILADAAYAPRVNPSPAKSLKHGQGLMLAEDKSARAPNFADHINHFGLCTEITSWDKSECFLWILAYMIFFQIESDIGTLNEG